MQLESMQESEKCKINDTFIKWRKLELANDGAVVCHSIEQLASWTMKFHIKSPICTFPTTSHAVALDEYERHCCYV